MAPFFLGPERLVFPAFGATDIIVGMEPVLMAICAGFGAFFIWLVLRICNRPDREFFDVMATVCAPIGLLLVAVVFALLTMHFVR